MNKTKTLISIYAGEPIGVSQWREEGKRLGYWQFFEEQVTKKYQDWMREFAFEMSALGVSLPLELGDVKAVVEAIKEKMK